MPPPPRSSVVNPNRQATVLTEVDAATVIAALSRALGDLNIANTLAMCLAHVALEQGRVGGVWTASFNHSLGNAKATLAEPHCYRWCGENVKIALANSLAGAFPHIVAIKRVYGAAPNPTMAAIEVFPPDPLPEAWDGWSIATMCRFRAFASFDEAATFYVHIMLVNYREALEVAASGNIDTFCERLKSRYYFSAPLETYQAGMRAQYEIAKKDLRAMADSSKIARDYVNDLAERLLSEVSAGQYAARVVRGFNGANPKKSGILYEVCARVEDRPAVEMYRTTNCATWSRWILALLGCTHARCYWPDERIRAFDPAGPVSWLLAIGFDLGAVVTIRDAAHAREVIGAGWLVHYATPGHNDDHMEWCVNDNDLEHCGAGRDGNYVTCGSSDVAFSRGRPARHAFNPERMGFRALALPVPTEPPTKPELASPEVQASERPTISPGSPESPEVAPSPDPEAKQAPAWVKGLAVILGGLAIGILSWLAEHCR